MKLLIKMLVLILASPYLAFSYYLFIEWYESPPIVSQESIVEVFEIAIADPMSVLEFENLTYNQQLKSIPLSTSKTLDLCDGAWRDFKSYMNYKTITNRNSQQYKFISEFMDVHFRDGLLRLKSDTRFIGVALGSYFGEIGSKFKFTLEGGNVFYAVKVEEKADVHVHNGCVHKQDSSIIEFVVNSNFAAYYPNAFLAGSLHVIPGFEGMIVGIERIK